MPEHAFKVDITNDTVMPIAVVFVEVSTTNCSILAQGFRHLAPSLLNLSYLLMLIPDCKYEHPIRIQTRHFKYYKDNKVIVKTHTMASPVELLSLSNPVFKSFTV